MIVGIMVPVGNGMQNHHNLVKKDYQLLLCENERQNRGWKKGDYQLLELKN